MIKSVWFYSRNILPDGTGAADCGTFWVEFGWKAQQKDEFSADEEKRTQNSNTIGLLACAQPQIFRSICAELIY